MERNSAPLPSLNKSNTEVGHELDLPPPRRQLPFGRLAMRLGADFDLQSYRPIRGGRAAAARPVGRDAKTRAVVSIESIDAVVDATRKLGFEKATIPPSKDESD